MAQGMVLMKKERKKGSGGARPKTGPKPRPGGGRLIVVQTKVTAEDALQLERERMALEKDLNKPITQSEFTYKRIFGRLP